MNGGLPSWFAVMRALLLLFCGVAMLLHEAFGATPAGPLIIVTALLLLGFSAADVAALWRGSGGT